MQMVFIQKYRKYLTSGATIAAVVATAHMMQRNGDANARDALPEPEIAAETMADTIATPMTAGVLGVSAPEVGPEVGPDAAPMIVAEAPAPDVVVPEVTAPEADMPEAVIPVVDVAKPEPAEAADPVSKMEMLAELDAADPETPDLVDIASLDIQPDDDAPAAVVVEIPDMPSDSAIPEPLELKQPTPLDRMAPVEEAAPEELPEEPGRNEYGLACDVILSASAQTAGMVRLMLTAPCAADERLTVRHEGLIFSDETDALGMYTVDVPALSIDASFSVTLASGETAETAVDVPEAMRTERVVLQYNGDNGLQIHALEFGADYGDAGHIWSGNPGSVEAATRTGGGFLTMLGDRSQPDAFLAEVYTLPEDARGQDGVVRLSVEAEVTAANCNRDIAGQTIQRTAAGGMRPVSLTLSMPDCDAAGEFLVLKNLLRDLKIASY